MWSCVCCLEKQDWQPDSSRYGRPRRFCTLYRHYFNQARNNLLNERLRCVHMMLIPLILTADSTLSCKRTYINIYWNIIRDCLLRKCSGHKKQQISVDRTLVLIRLYDITNACVTIQSVMTYREICKLVTFFSQRHRSGGLLWFS